MENNYSTEEVRTKFYGKYIEVYSYYDYLSCTMKHHVKKVYDTIYENTCLGQDVGTEMQYRRQVNCHLTG